MISRRATALLAFLLVSLSGTAAATVSLGTTNTFESGTTEGWVSGAGNPTQPSNMSGGSPARIGDN